MYCLHVSVFVRLCVSPSGMAEVLFSAVGQDARSHQVVDTPVCEEEGGVPVSDPRTP